MKKLFETAMIIVGTLGWWGFVYPELCLMQEYDTQDQAGVICEVEAPSIHIDSSTSQENKETIQIKSLIAEYIYQIRVDGKENDDG